MPAGDERQLIHRVKEGDHDAFRVLVRRYMKHAYNVAYGFLNNHEDAEDIAQESFVRAFRSIGSFRGDSQFSTWLYRIVMNLSLNRLKQRRARRESILTDASTAHLGDNPLVSQQVDVRVHIEKALLRLSALQRAVVILRHVDGLSTRQVSSILRCSEGTVKTHLHRGLMKMRSGLRFLKDERE